MVKGNKSKIDNLGRVVIPKSIRKALDVEHNDEISMHVENRALIITKLITYAQYVEMKKSRYRLKINFCAKTALMPLKIFN